VKRVSIFISILLFLSAYLLFGGDRIGKVYTNIKKMSEKRTPNSYKVKVDNKRFSEALKELPEDVLSGNKTPYVSIEFKKDSGVKIVIEDIKSEYTSLFSMYEDYFKFSGISKTQNPIEFKEIIDKNKVSFYKEEKDSIIVQAWDPEKEEKGDNYAFFYLDKEKWVIKKAVYYLDGKPYVKAENSYENYGKYYMPYKIVLTNLNDNTEDVFLFKEYRFNK